MKNLILSLLGLLIINLTIAQPGNGGQSDSNSVMVIKFAGFYGTQTIVEVRNKTNCTDSVKFSTTGNGNIVQYKLVAALSTDTVHMLIPISKNVKIQANMLQSACNSESGVIELNLDLSALPLKFLNFKVNRISDTECYIDFQIAEVDNVREIYIKISLDGKTFTVAKTLKPNQTVYHEYLDLTPYLPKKK